MSPRDIAARIRRFIPLAARSVQFDLQIASRSLKSSARGVLKSIRRAWWRSDPVGWKERMDALFAPNPEFAAGRERELQRLAQARERFLLHGATFSGRLHARVVYRGMILERGEMSQDLDAWLSEQLGLDAYHGDQLDVRITIEPLDDPAQPTGGRDE